VVLVERIFSEKLKTKIILRYKTIDGQAVSTTEPKEDEPLVKAALDRFKGKIVSQWHKE
jgi:hypothetical protein